MSTAGHWTCPRHHPCPQVGCGLGRQAGSRSAIREAAALSSSSSHFLRSSFPESPILCELVSPPINNADSLISTWLPTFSERAPSLRSRVKLSSAGLTPHHHEEILKLEHWYLPSWFGVLNSHNEARTHESTYTAHTREAVGTPRNNGKSPWVSLSSRDYKFGWYVYTFSSWFSFWIKAWTCHQIVQRLWSLSDT